MFSGVESPELPRAIFAVEALNNCAATWVTRSKVGTVVDDVVHNYPESISS